MEAMQTAVKTTAAVKTFPFFDVTADLPSLAQDQENRITAEELLGSTSPTVFVVKVSGPSMEGAHLPNGTTVMVDPGVRHKVGDIVAGLLNGEFIIKRILKTHAGWVLHPENPSFIPYLIKPDDEFKVLGVVKGAIIKF
ncbi:DNA polymerase V [Chitinophaga terrae (ex Kim and Jung 2007)]|uniref:LexA family protein n=1 Tax=Chitinophaga terrae (ex Kim and Jung 2007) TaxID=408074 RepID=UPI0027847BC7|nr:S24 family peptidase [Chitinophaga terrae (ex Kim and Jung 2007)]MDQ0107452.1 DNA polymerase V [Chitinophaga terrae (ex Kim and Jung 2007)]